MPEKISNSQDLTRLALSVINDKQGENAVAYDTRGMNLFCDYIVLVTGRNTPHLKVLRNTIHAVLKENGHASFRLSGLPESGWIMADYSDVLIHLFLAETREYYALDELLRHAPKMEQAST